MTFHGSSTGLGPDALLQIWREACRSTDIESFAPAAARMVSGLLEVDLLLVRRLEVGRSRLDTVATWIGPGRDVPRARTEGPLERIDEVADWCRHGALLRGDPGADGGLLARLAPDGARGSWIAGPLFADEPLGALLLAAPKGGALRSACEPIVASLLEPFAAVLENDRRLHELARSRETAEADNRALLTRLQRQDISESVVGAEAGLAGVMERVEKVAQTDAPVLILGETGSGKEVIARAIHGRSRRGAGPIVRVNCGAIPPELVDSELFGHERGSFTGAVGTHRGWFERADGGTLFLDEIGELPLAVQVRLLRVLQDGSFERVGGKQPLSVDVRLVAATHRNLEEMVAERRFREDLWYRISVFPIRLPPLRDRLADIPALAAHFAWGAGKRLAGVPLVPSQSDIELLLAYAWPGNVRELASVIERAAILGDGRGLEVAAALGGGSRGSHAPRPDEARAPRGERVTTLDAATVVHIQRALEATRGRIEGPGGAARLLGVNPHTLRARMRKLGIVWSRFRGG